MYANSWYGVLLLDDWPTWATNDALHKLWPPRWAVVSENGGLTTDGRPLGAFTLALNWAIHGQAVGGYHIVNLAIHLGAALALFGAVRRTLRLPSLAPRLGAGATAIGFCAALLWVVHPLTTAAVTYIVQRVESLAALLTLLALYGFVRGLDSGPSRRWFGLTLLACLLGVATKETFVTVPFLLLLFDRIFAAASWREVWQRRGRWHLAFAGTLLLLAALMISTGNRGTSIGASSVAASLDYAVTQIGGVMGYLSRTFWPANLIFDYGRANTPFSEVIPQAVILAGLLGGTAFVGWRWPRAGFLPLVWFLLLAPTSSFVPVITQALTEHRTYLPSAAVITGVVILLFVVLGRRTVVLVALVVGLSIPLGVTTVRRNEVYRDAIGLWTETITKRPKNARAYFSMAVELQRLGRVPDAIPFYRQAIALDPKSVEGHHGFAMALVALGDREGAVAEFEQALALEPRYLLSIVNLGQSLLALQRSAAALPWLEKAVEMDPKAPEPKLNLASALVQIGQPARAIDVLEGVVRDHPGHVAGHYNLGIHYARQRRSAEAEREYRAALALAPGFVDAQQNLGNLLMREGRLADAVVAFAAAVAAAPDERVLNFSLTIALAQSGRTAEALVAIERFLARHPGDAEAVQIRADLQRSR